MQALWEGLRKSALIPDNNMGDKTKYAREVLTPCRSLGDPLCSTTSALFAIFWTLYCPVLSRLIKGQLIVAAQWCSALMTQHAWFEARYRWFSLKVLWPKLVSAKHTSKDGSFQFKLQLKGTMCSVLHGRQKRTKWRQWCLKCHKCASDVKVGSAASWCNSPLL